MEEGDQVDRVRQSPVGEVSIQVGRGSPWLSAEMGRGCRKGYCIFEAIPNQVTRHGTFAAADAAVSLVDRVHVFDSE